MRYAHRPSTGLQSPPPTETVMAFNLVRPYFLSIPCSEGTQSERATGEGGGEWNGMEEGNQPGLLCESRGVGRRENSETYQGCLPSWNMEMYN